jgi:copper transport protein
VRRSGRIVVVTRGARLAWLGLAGLLFGLLFGLAVPATPAWAHAYLVASDPADGAVVGNAPQEVTLSFSEPVRLVADRILVVGPDGERVDQGEPQREGADVTIPLDGAAEAQGTYLVSFRVVSADSHPVAGSITFSVGAPSEPPTVPVSQDLDDPALRTAMGVSRYVGYAGLVLVVGPALVLARLWPQRLPRRSMSRTLWIGLGLVGASTLASVWLQGPYSTGGRLSETSAGDVGEVLQSTYGQAHLVRLGVIVAVGVMLRPLTAGRAGRADLVLLAVLAVVGLGTWPVAGHPVASPLPAVSIAATTVHLAAAAFWIGGLVVLVAFLLRLANQRELGAILPVWSGWAALAVVALLITGLIQAVIEVGTLGAVWSTSYGRFLLAKVGLVGAVIGIAAFSRWLVRQRLAALQPRAMRMAVGLEAALLAVVVAVSSALVQTTPARTEAAAGQAVTGAAAPSANRNRTLTHDLFTLEVLVEPGEVGDNTVHLYAFTSDREQLPVAEWTATAALPEAGVEPMTIRMQRITDNHALGDVSLPLAGEWLFRFTVRVSEVDQATVATTVPVG